MAQDIVIRSITYDDVPQVEIPKQGGGTAVFVDTSDATLDSGDQMLNGVTAYAYRDNGVHEQFRNYGVSHQSNYSTDFGKHECVYRYYGELQNLCANSKP